MQKAYFRQACGTARFVWNWALAEWNDRYEVGANPDACQIKRYFNSFKYEAFLCRRTFIGTLTPNLLPL